jgi:hypothetical protein
MRALLFSLAFTLTVIIGQDAFANRLTEAATRGSSMVLTLAQTTSGIGIALGAILLSMGIAQAGKNVLSGGVIGAFVTFGGPAIVDFLRGLF